MSVCFAYIDPGTGLVVYGTIDWLLGLVAGMALAFWAYVKGVGRYVWNHPRWRAFCVIILVLACLGAAYYMVDRKTVGGNGSRTVILGFDGMSPELYERWAGQGRLPHLRSLQERGGYSRLDTTVPPHSPVAWASFLTGTCPERHGVTDFIKRDPATYALRLASSEFNKRGQAVPFLRTQTWAQWAAQEHIPCDILFCPVTFPAGSDVMGRSTCDRARLIAGMGVPDILGTEGTFTYYTSDRAEAERLGAAQSGRIVPLAQGSTVVTQVSGPRVANWRGQVKEVALPLRVDRLDNSLRLTWEGQSLVLPVGQWSAWQSFTFPLGWRREMKAIARFVALEAGDRVRLYMSPLQHDPRQPFMPVVFPEGWGREICEALGPFATLGMPDDTWPVNTGIISTDLLLAQAELTFQEHLALLRHELGQHRSGLLMAYFGTTDTVQHMFWRELQAALKRDDGSDLKSPIFSYYQKCDELVGEVLSDLGSEDTLVVLSDHGFNSFERAAHLNTFLRSQGLQKLRDQVPTGRELLADVDWSVSQCYAAGFNALYFNLKGREKAGCVEPEQIEALRERVTRLLLDWRDADGRRVVANVYPGHNGVVPSDSGAGDNSDGPDLIVGYAPGFRASWQTAMGASPMALLEDNTLQWSGDHLFDAQAVPGVLFVSRPLKPAEKRPSLCDLAPSLLRGAGASQKLLDKAAFDGSVLW